MQMPALDANLIISAILIALGVYGLLAGKQRLRILILSVYVGIVLAEQLRDAVSSTLPMTSPTQISWLLLGLPIVVYGFVGVVHARGHDKGSSIANVLVGLLTGALIVSSALRLMAPSELSDVNSSSFVALILQQNHLWFLGLLPAIALVLGWLKTEKSH